MKLNFNDFLLGCVIGVFIYILLVILVELFYEIIKCNKTSKGRRR